jgi:hypothetical protein
MLRPLPLASQEGYAGLFGRNGTRVFDFCLHHSFDHAGQVFVQP